VKIVRFVPSVLLFFFLGAAAHAEKAFLGAIPVQFVAPDTELVLDMHRFYQPGRKPKLDFATNDDVELAWDAVAFQLRARAKKKGISDVLLSTQGQDGKITSLLTLASTTGTPVHHFTFKPAGTAEAGASAEHKIYLAGSFNGWSTTKTPLTGPNRNGEYSVDVPLGPGRYTYKFFADGKWTPDPNSSDTENDGMGGKNSVVTISAEKAANAPSIYAERLTADKMFVRAITGGDSIEKVSAIFEGKEGSTPLAAKIDGNEIEVALPEKKSGFVRVIVANADGVPSNVVRCSIGTSRAFHWQDAVLYYALTDRFCDGDKSNDHPIKNPKVLWPANYHGGDWRGIREKIDSGYFQSLGVNAIWIAPLNKNPDRAYRESPEPHRWYTGYHGYWPVSPTEVDPHFGTPADLHALVNSAHKHGIKIVADLVLHHVHKEHPWWKQHRDWFGHLYLPDGRENLRLWDEEQFTTWFEPYLPSFDFSKAAPVRALIDNTVWSANTYNLDGFRLDAVKHILPSFWWKFRAALRERVDAHRVTPLYLVGETFKDRPGIMQFVGPNMLDGQFDFPLYDQIQETFGETKGDMKALDDSLRASERIDGKETIMSPLIGNHDKGRFMAYADGELPDPNGLKDGEVGWKDPPKVRGPSNYKKLELAQTFLMSIDGVPMIYYGDEIGMTGAGDPDNRRDMRFGNQVSANEKGVLRNFDKLGAIRREHPALRYGSRRTVLETHDQYAFLRADLGDRVAVIFNRAHSPAKIDINVSPEMADGSYVDALSGSQVEVKNGRIDLELPAESAAFVTKSP
jgi:cyclomaltodextrinase